MRAMCSSLSMGWALYALGLLTVFVASEMTRSFEIFLAVHVAVGIVLLCHRAAAGSRIATEAKHGVLPVDVALFGLLWPVLACVGLLVLSVPGMGRRSAASDAPA